MVEQSRMGIIQNTTFYNYTLLLEETNSANPEDLFITTRNLIYSWEQT